MNDNTIKWLITCPATDGNFKSHLQRATAAEIMEAITVMTGKGKGNASRISACQRELRKRDKKL